MRAIKATDASLSLADWVHIRLGAAHMNIPCPLVKPHGAPDEHADTINTFCCFTSYAESINSLCCFHPKTAAKRVRVLVKVDMESGPACSTEGLV